MNPFGVSPFCGVSNAVCVNILVFLPGRDLAAIAMACRGFNAVISEVVALASVTLYNRSTPSPRENEGWARTLHFLEALTRNQALARLPGPAVSTGTFHTLVVAGDGQVHVFGESESGQVRVAMTSHPFTTPSASMVENAATALSTHGVNDSLAGVTPDADVSLHRHLPFVRAVWFGVPVGHRQSQQRPDTPAPILHASAHGCAGICG